MTTPQVTTTGEILSTLHSQKVAAQSPQAPASPLQQAMLESQQRAVERARLTEFQQEQNRLRFQEQLAEARAQAELEEVDLQRARRAKERQRLDDDDDATQPLPDATAALASVFNTVAQMNVTMVDAQSKMMNSTMEMQRGVMERQIDAAKKQGVDTTAIQAITPQQLSPVALLQQQLELMLKIQEFSKTLQPPPPQFAAAPVGMSNMELQLQMKKMDYDMQVRLAELGHKTKMEDQEFALRKEEIGIKQANNQQMAVAVSTLASHLGEIVEGFKTPVAGAAVVTAPAQATRPGAYAPAQVQAAQTPPPAQPAGALITCPGQADEAGKITKSCGHKTWVPYGSQSYQCPGCGELNELFNWQVIDAVPTPPAGQMPPASPPPGPPSANGQGGKQ